MKAGEKITVVSVFVNLFLSALKFAVGIASSSYALVTDSLHSLSDLATDFLAFLGITFAEQPGDSEHPYGHGRVATISTILIACILMAACAYMVWESATIFFFDEKKEEDVNALLAFVAALVSFGVKEWLFKKTRNIAKDSRSGVLMSNALHHRLDSLSSLVVAVGLVVIWLGGEKFKFIDPLLSFALALWLGFEGVKMFVPAFEDLLDTAPSEAVLADLREHISEVRGVKGYHKIRARKLGDVYEMDMHIQVDGNMSVREGHDIAKKIKKLIFKNHPEVISVLIHVEPDHD